MRHAPTGFDPDELYRWVEEQAALGSRRPGSAGGRANEEFLLDRLRSFGLPEVRSEEVPVTAWHCDEAALTVAGVPYPVFGIPFTAFTGPGYLKAPLIYAEPGALSAPASWRGKIVVAEIRFPALDTARLLRLALGKYDPDGDLADGPRPATWIRLGWHQYQWAAKRGAAGFVGIVRDQPGGTQRMYAPYGFKEKDILDKPIPGLWASRRDGEALVRAARAGTLATLTLRGTSAPAMSHNIVAEIPGETDEAIVISTHHDSPFVSPVEDGTGVAVVLGLARHFARMPKRRRRLVFLFSAGHFYGSIGTRTFIARHRQGLVARTALEISIEHVAREACEDAQGRLVATGRPEPTGIFVPFSRTVRDLLVEALAKHGHKRSLLLPSEGPLGDYPPTDGGDWYEAGVPVINYISNPVYLLTDEDALDWVDKPRLAVVAALFADVVTRLDGVSTRSIARIDFPGRLAVMKLLKHAMRAKTTRFGLWPLH